LLSIMERALKYYAPVYEGEDERWKDSFADVAQAFLEQHRFEHGDTDDFEHLIVIDFTSPTTSAVSVVSPAADAAREAENQELAEKLGGQLRAMLEESGISTDGLELELDENGRITVAGDVDDATLRQARALIDHFTREAKAFGTHEKNPDEAEAAREGRNILTGREEDRSDPTVDTADAWIASKRREETTAALTEKIRPYLPNPNFDDPLAPDAASYRIRNAYISWQSVLPKNESGPAFFGTSTAVSAVGTPRFGEESYGDDAAGLYRQLVDGMSQFHDGRSRMSYTLLAA
ncbi:MAG: hypothetical protein LIP77_12325, partial [Planctomycetes bacterium]|nr:hypothetical protein [Planctomycetota bacterium]